MWNAIAVLSALLLAASVYIASLSLCLFISEFDFSFFNGFVSFSFANFVSNRKLLFSQGGAFIISVGCMFSCSIISVTLVLHGSFPGL